MSKLAISDIAWNLSEEDKIFKLMKNLGVKNLEISPFKLQENIPMSDGALNKEIFSKLNDYGISIIAVQSLLYRHPELMIFENKKIRKKTLIHLLNIIDFASKVGAKVLVFGSPKNKIKGRLSDSQSLKIAVDFFDTIGDKAKSLGLKFCLEPTPRAYGADFIVNTKEAIDLLKKIGNDGLGINIDLGSLILNDEQVEDSILKAAPYMTHIHISEPFLKPINLDYSFHRKVASVIQSVGYEGGVSVEMLFRDASNLNRVKETLSFVKNIYSIS